MGPWVWWYCRPWQQWGPRIGIKRQIPNQSLGTETLGLSDWQGLNHCHPGIVVLYSILSRGVLASLHQAVSTSCQSKDLCSRPENQNLDSTSLEGSSKHKHPEAMAVWLWKPPGRIDLNYDACQVSTIWPGNVPQILNQLTSTNIWTLVKTRVTACSFTADTIRLLTIVGWFM